LPVLLGASASRLALTLLATLGVMSTPVLIAVLALLGFSTPMVSVVMAHGRSLVPPHLLGRTITLLNIGTMGGGFLAQFISGVVIGLFAAPDGVYPLDAYRLVFGLQAAFVIVAMWVYLGSRDSYLAR
jgi:MFS family permease